MSTLIFTLFSSNQERTLIEERLSFFRISKVLPITKITDIKDAVGNIAILTTKDHESVLRSQIEQLRYESLRAGKCNLYFFPIIRSADENKTVVQKGRKSMDHHFDDAFRKELANLNNNGPGPILIQGQIGTGKTELARAIHRRSGRPEELFGTINPKMYGNSVSSFFYGVVKNYYTGVGERESEFKRYDGGSILIDDFQDMQISDQVALLELIDPFTNYISASRIGEKRPDTFWSANVQVILAINRPAHELIKAGILRPDLNSRIQKTVTLSPICEKIEAAQSRHGTDEVNAFLRHELLKVQERALIDLVQQDLQNFRGKGIDFFSDYANWEVSNVDEMPILEAFRKYKFYANFRDIEGIARKLLFRHQRMGGWSSVNLEQVINEMRNRYEGSIDALEDSTSTLSRVETEYSPKQLMSLAFLKAISRSNASISSIAKDLDLDKRTVEKLIRRIANDDFQPDEEKWTFGMDAKGIELAKKTSKRLILSF